eukprot:8504856-Pyramimonas_sp.AAC.1
MGIPGGVVDSLQAEPVMPPLLGHCVVAHAALTLVTGRLCIRRCNKCTANLAKPLALVPLRRLKVPIREDDPR